MGISVTNKEDFIVKFWGVRGTMPTPGVTTIRYGGNTSCVEMRCGERTLIFDAGTGIYPMGESRKISDVDLLLSHTHIDHILGFPFFSPAYNPEATIRIWAGHLMPEMSIRDAMGQLMSPPLFPLTLNFLKATVDYRDFKAGEDVPSKRFAEEGIRIRTLPLNHPDRATGYRVEFMGKSVCYITDIEHQTQDPNPELVEFVKGTQLLIYDSTFDDRDFERFVGWGHSTWQHAAKVADAAQVDRLVLFHHDPGISDDGLDKREQELRMMRPNDLVAHEGLTIKLN